MPIHSLVKTVPSDEATGGRQFGGGEMVVLSGWKLTALSSADPPYPLLSTHVVLYTSRLSQIHLRIRHVHSLESSKTCHGFLT